MMTRTARLGTAAGALLLGALYLTPLWRIQLFAPQYPEGLGLRIWVDRIAGAAPQDLNSINNLNHYIGMRRIVPDEIPELRYMPWILAGLIAFGVVAAVAGRRRLVLAWLAAIAAGTAAGLADFWKWGYDYGHHLSPEAIIKIPGMSYQPPVIGNKQLLNFSASSWPDIGAWMALVAVGVTIAVLVRDRHRARGAAA